LSQKIQRKFEEKEEEKESAFTSFSLQVGNKSEGFKNL